MGPVRRSAPGPAVEGGYASSQTMFVCDVALDDMRVTVCGDRINVYFEIYLFLARRQDATACTE